MRNKFWIVMGYLALTYFICITFVGCFCAAVFKEGRRCCS